MTETALTSDHSDDSRDHDGHAHPTEKQYWVVFVVLVVLTAVEIAWSYMGFEGPALVVPLLGMMVVKFLVVAGAFMHLYFDMKILHGKFFATVFGGALLAAMFLYFIVFLASDQVFASWQ